MPFDQPNAISWKFTGQPYDLNSVLSPDQVWANLDSPPEDVRQALISLVNALNATTASTNVGFSPNADVDANANTVQLAFNALVNLLHGTGGAAWLKSVGIAGLTGDNVQSLLESLKAYVENDFTTKDEITNNRKLSPSGNFTGTWNGVQMTSAEPGLSSAFNAHLAEIATQLQIGHVKGSASIPVAVDGTISLGGIAVPNNDLNQATTTGIYNFNSGATNAPHTGYGIIQVTVSNGDTQDNSSNWVWQYATNTGSDELFIRYKINNSPWTTWKRLLLSLGSDYKVQNGSGTITLTSANTLQSVTVSYPIAFNTNPLVFTELTGANSNAASTFINLFAYQGGVTTSGFPLNASSGAAQTLQFNWFAIGS